MINDERIRLSLRMGQGLYIKFRDKAHKSWKTHNHILEALVEKWVAGEVDLEDGGAKASRRKA